MNRKQAGSLPRKPRLAALLEEAESEENDDADFIRMWLEGGAGAQTLAQVQSGMAGTARPSGCVRYALLDHVADGSAVATVSV